jgi:Domain of unknown function (DUF4157)
MIIPKQVTPSKLRQAAAKSPLQLIPALRDRLEAALEIRLEDLRLVESSIPFRLRANAIACGETIFFASGSLDWRTAKGRRLFGHELAHIRQQQNMPAPAALSICDDRLLEQEANDWGGRLEALLPFDCTAALAPASRPSSLSNILQCASMVISATQYVGGWLSWGYSKLPGWHSAQTPQQQNEENMNSTAEEIETITAMKRQADSDVPVFVPPKPEPIVPTNDQIASSIAKMTLAENMARLSPTQLYLRNQLLSRTVMLNNPGFNPAPPTQNQLQRAAGGLLPIQTRETSMLPGAQEDYRLISLIRRERQQLLAGERNALLRPTQTIEKSAFDSYKQEYTAATIEKMKLDYYNRKAVVESKASSVTSILRDPILKTFYVAMNAAYKSKPEDQLTIGDLNNVLALVSVLEVRLKESQEIVGQLQQLSSNGFFDRYFDNEVSSWDDLEKKLGEMGSSSLKYPQSSARWKSILAEYGATPRNKAQILDRLGELTRLMDREVVQASYTKMSKYERGFERELSSGTGSWRCRITITSEAWSLMASHNPEQILEILSKNPIPIQNDGKTKGNRAIKPEPWGWIFSTSVSTRLSAKIEGASKWPPTALNFNFTHEAH